MLHLMIINSDIITRASRNCLTLDMMSETILMKPLKNEMLLLQNQLNIHNYADVLEKKNEFIALVNSNLSSRKICIMSVLIIICSLIEFVCYQNKNNAL